MISLTEYSYSLDVWPSTIKMNHSVPVFYQNISSRFFRDFSRCTFVVYHPQVKVHSSIFGKLFYHSIFYQLPLLRSYKVQYDRLFHQFDNFKVSTLKMTRVGGLQSFTRVIMFRHSIYHGGSPLWPFFLFVLGRQNGKGKRKKTCFRLLNQNSVLLSQVNIKAYMLVNHSRMDNDNRY